jgi:PKD repeat protein
MKSPFTSRVGWFLCGALSVFACGPELPGDGDGELDGELDLLEQEVEAACSPAQLVGVVASVEQAGNEAPGAIDGSLDTRWSGKGVGASLTADLGAAKRVCGASLAWYQGDLRTNSFFIEVSSNNTAFTRVFTGTSAPSAALQGVSFPAVDARWVRLVFNGNSVNEWASVTEFRPDALAPVAAFELEARDLSLSVDDAASSGGDSAIASYAWTFGDGQSATGRTPQPHTYAAAGTYQVKLTVTNTSGQTSSSTRSVTVAARAPGSYAPDDATTGVPDIVKDRLFLLDLEKPNKSSSNLPSVDDETLYVTYSGGAYAFRRNGVAVAIPAANASVIGGRLVLDRLHVRGYVNVQAPNVTLRRSIIEAVSLPTGVTVGRRLLRGNNVATTGLLIEDVELKAPAAVQRGPGLDTGYHHGLGLEASRLTLLRSEISGTVDGSQVHQGAAASTAVLFERNWIHDMQYYLVDNDRTQRDATHSDGVQVECSLPASGQIFGVRLLGNTIDMTSDVRLNAAIQVTNNACATSGLQIRDNFLDGAPFSLNVGGASAAKPIHLYVNDNHFGPNRATGSHPNKVFTVSYTAKVVVGKSNTDGGAGWENRAGNQQYVYLSFDPPTAVGGQPPTGEANRNVMVTHTRGSTTWGTTSQGVAQFGWY